MLDVSYNRLSGSIPAAYNASGPFNSQLVSNNFSPVHAAANAMQSCSQLACVSVLIALEGGSLLVGALQI